MSIIFGVNLIRTGWQGETGYAYLSRKGPSTPFVSFFGGVILLVPPLCANFIPFRSWSDKLYAAGVGQLAFQVFYKGLNIDMLMAPVEYATMTTGFFLWFLLKLFAHCPERASLIIVSATSRESVSFHRPLRSTLFSGFTRYTLVVVAQPGVWSNAREITKKGSMLFFI